MSRSDHSRLDLAAAGAQGVLGFHLGALGSALVLLARDFEVPLLTLGWLSSGFGVSLLLFGLVGAKALQLGATNLTRISVVVMAGGGALIAVAPTLGLAQLGAGLLGIGGAASVLCTPALVVGSGMARRLVLVTAASSVTAVVAPLALGLTDRLTVDSGRLAMLIPIPFALALAVRRLPRLPVVIEERSSMVRRRVVARGWLSMVLGISAEFGFLLWGAARLVDSGSSTVQAAAGAAAFPVGMALARVFGFRFAGHRDALRIACGLTALGALLVAAPAGPIVVMAGLAVGGSGAAFLYPLTLSVLLETSQLPRHRAAPIATAASGAAVLLGPALLRVVADFGGLRLGFLSILPLMALLVIVVPRDRRPGTGHSGVATVAPPFGS